jgi:hypothetical protein
MSKLPVIEEAFSRLAVSREYIYPSNPDFKSTQTPGFNSRQDRDVIKVIILQ